jgi:kynurenine formamidase
MAEEEPSPEEVLSWTRSLSNWGRWGSGDHLGTLNYITADVRRAAGGEIRQGRSISCAWPIDASPRLDGRPNRLMMSTGEACGRSDPPQRVAVASDMLQLQIHSFQITHLDALSHWFLDARMYNDRPAELVTAEDGARELGIETVRDGIVTRGLLLDVAAVREVESLLPGDAVLPDDLERAAARQSTQVRSGDALLLYTGHGRRRRQEAGAPATSAVWPGWHAACLPWIHEREVALLASEASNEVMPNQYALLGRHPIHTVGIAAMGLWLLDYCNMESLAQACRASGQWSFLFAATPLPVQGATGSPLNPVAIL